MQFSTSFISLLAAASAAAAMPWSSSNVAPVPASQLTCDGTTNKCTAALQFGSGGWVGQWSATVSHSSLWGAAAKSQMAALSMAPVPVTKLQCDGTAFQCIANLDFGDGNWIATWPANVFQNKALFGRKAHMHTMAPVPASNLQCDGTAFQCSANLDFGDGTWVAEWTSAVFQNSGFIDQH